MAFGNRFHAAVHYCAGYGRYNEGNRSADQKAVALLLEDQEVHEGKDSREYAHNPGSKLRFGYRQVADHLAALAVHGEEVCFALPVGAQEPYREHSVFRLVGPDLLALLADIDAVVVFDRAFECGAERADCSVVCAFAAFFLADVVLVGQIAGHVFHAEGPHFLVVEGLDGVHQVVGHLCGGVDGDLAEAHRALSVDVIVLLPDDLFIACAAAVFFDSFVLRAAFHFTGEHPERHVNALDLLDVVVGLEGFGEEKPSFVIFLEGTDCLFLVHFEGNYIVRTVYAREFPGDDRGISAIRAFRRRCRLVADQLRAASRAVVSTHMSRVAPPAGSIRSAKSPRRPGGAGSPARSRRCSLRRSFCLVRLLVCLSICCRCTLDLVRVERFDLLCGVSAAAVFAFQLANLPVKTQRPRTGRALVNSDLFCHIHSPFCCLLLSRCSPIGKKCLNSRQAP